MKTLVILKFPFAELSKLGPVPDMIHRGSSEITFRLYKDVIVNDIFTVNNLADYDEIFVLDKGYSSGYDVLTHIMSNLAAYDMAVDITKVLKNEE